MGNTNPNQRGFKGAIVSRKTRTFARAGVGAVVTKIVPGKTVVMGVPALPYLTRKEYGMKRLR